MPSEKSTIQGFWAENHTVKDYGIRDVMVQCPRLRCADGFAMSVQASAFHYSTPCAYLRDGSYSAWEIGFPTARDDALMPYVEDASEPTETVYGYVPTEVVNAVIAAHGGLVALTKEASDGL